MGDVGRVGQTPPAQPGVQTPPASSPPKQEGVRGGLLEVLKLPQWMALAPDDNRFGAVDGFSHPDKPAVPAASLFPVIYKDGKVDHAATSEAYEGMKAPSSPNRLSTKYGDGAPTPEASTQGASATQAPQELKNLDETDKKDLKEWAAIIHKNPWLLPKNPADRAAWLELANAVDNAVATGDWSLPDGIAGQNPKVGEQIGQSMNSWHAYWHNANVAAAQAHSPAASAARVADARKDYETKQQVLEDGENRVNVYKNYLAGLKNGTYTAHNQAAEIARVTALLPQLERERDEAGYAAGMALEHKHKVEVKEGVVEPNKPYSAPPPEGPAPVAAAGPATPPPAAPTEPQPIADPLSGMIVSG